MIAEKAGVSRMSVSRALRNDRAIQRQTGDQIRKVARELGYRPDPNLARVMEATRRGRRADAPTAIAYLTAFAEREEWRQHPVRRRFFEGAQQRADESGYRLEEFSVRTPSMTDERLSEIIRHRGIEGLLVAPLPTPQPLFERFRWDYFSVVQIGYSLPSPDLHRACCHQYQSILLLAQRLYEAGYVRVGIAMNREQDDRVHHHWRAGHLAAHSLWGEGDGGELMLLTNVWTQETFESWLKRAAPDAIITIGSNAAEWLDALGVHVPRDLGVANIDLRPDMNDVTGIDQNSLQVGAAAFDLLISLLHRSERGVPSIPRVSLVHGTFVQGRTTRRASATYQSAEQP
jgi:LacI family transcriptional regulator